MGLDDHAIARHLGHDRKTIRVYLDGRVAGQRRRLVPDPFGVFVDYCRASGLDPHLWALFDEVTTLGYRGSYPSFTRGLRWLRPHCEPFHPAAKRPVVVIEHPVGRTCPMQESDDERFDGGGGLSELSLFELHGRRLAHRVVRPVALGRHINGNLEPSC